MKLITDLHIHSHYSLATSKQLTPEYLDLWGKMKGIQIIASGDFTHPGWTKELQEKIQPAENGLFTLKKDYKIESPIKRFDSEEYFTRFILSAEISSIYKKNGKVRKVHSVVLAPDFSTVEKIQQKLIYIGGNITSDGRPILGLDAKDLLEICLEASENIFFIPAHIWTPWFSVLGAKSGFDSIEECFEDLTPHIHAVETGLSTNAPMNWMCSFLDNFTLISNSDAHSPEKLGRNANIMDCELSYEGIIQTMKQDKSNKFLGTIDMYPQEGKYHYDGHRKCGVIYNPVETLEHNGICEKCGKKITVGVMNRIVQLSDRENLEERPNRLPFHSIIPLKEMISEILGVGPNSKTVTRKYNEVITNLGSELEILLNAPLDKIARTDSILSEAIDRMRKKQVIIKEGYDGEFGVIKVFAEGELNKNKNAPKLFPEVVAENKIQYKSKNLLNFSLEKYRELQKSHSIDTFSEEKSKTSDLNDEQQRAVEYLNSTALILAGPGTGKTKTLVSKIFFLVKEKNIKPDEILAITFTNKAADEIRQRIAKLLSQTIAEKLNIHTFHSFGLKILRENSDKINRTSNFAIIDEREQNFILKNHLKVEGKGTKKLIKQISLHKQNSENSVDEASFNQYQAFLQKNNLLDIDDLVFEPAELLQRDMNLASQYKNRFQYILIDEYQDINQIQFQLVKNLSTGNNIFAIGDNNQAIYGFRGADVNFINNFADHYPGSQIFQLTKSYRCSNQILQASADVINETNALSGLQKGVKIRIHQSETDKSEAEFIARKIEDIIGGTRFFSMDSNVTDGYDDSQNASLDEIVVLVRTKALMKSIAEAFKNHAIPYELVDNKPFYKEKPICDILDVYKYLKLENQIFHSTLEINKSDIDIETKSINEILQSIVDTYFSDEKDKYGQQIKRLLDFADNFKDEEEFLAKLSLGFSEDFYSLKTHNVKVMTLHAAKGLEFEHVFIAGCENKLIPYGLFASQKTDYEEERRLFYVGMTRSKKYLYLTSARSRIINGAKYNLGISPFVEKIKRDLLKEEKNRYKKKIKKDDAQLKLF